MNDKFSRRHFFFESLLAGTVPTAGIGSTASLPHSDSVAF
jgi:hypothetical protein